MITHILIDVHGVLTVGDERQKFLVKLKNKFNINPEEQNKFWQSYVDKLDKNEISSIDYLNFFNQKFKTPFSPDEYFNFFAEQITPNLKLLNYISKLSNKYKIIIISDNLLDFANRLNNILKNDFDKYQKYYSYQYGLTKKDGLLSLVIKDQKVDPESCIFIDDNQTNIDNAKKIGINSIIFQNNTQLFAQMENFLN